MRCFHLLQRKRKNEFFDSRKKAQDVCRKEVREEEATRSLCGSNRLSRQVSLWLSRHLTAQKVLNSYDKLQSCCFAGAQSPLSPHGQRSLKVNTMDSITDRSFDQLRVYLLKAVSMNQLSQACQAEQPNTSI